MPLENMNIKNAKVFKSDYLTALRSLQEQNLSFDVIFLDPPYKTNYIEKSIEKIDNQKMQHTLHFFNLIYFLFYVVNLRKYYNVLKQDIISFFSPWILNLLVL